MSGRHNGQHSDVVLPFQFLKVCVFEFKKDQDEWKKECIICMSDVCGGLTLEPET